MRQLSVPRIKSIRPVLVLVFVFLLVMLSQAKAETTTEQITTPDGGSGTRTTTVEGNTTTVTESVSGNTQLFGTPFYFERTTTTVTKGNPITSQTVTSTEKRYVKKGEKPFTTSVEKTTRSHYNDAGGYAEVKTATTTMGNKQIINTIETQRDAGGNIQSGTTTRLEMDNGQKTAETHSEWKDGDWKSVSMNPSPSPESAITANTTEPPSPAPSGHKNNSVVGWIVGVAALAGILVATGHNSTASTASNQNSQNLPLIFTPASVTLCQNKTATASVSDPNHPGATFDLTSASSNLQPTSPTTTGPFGIQPFAQGTATIKATEVGNGKSGSLPVTVTAPC